MSDDTFALTHPVVGRDGGDKLDYYPTPRWCTELLFEHAYKVDDRWPDARSVLDPAAGDGAILDVARERGFSTYCPYSSPYIMTSHLTSSSKPLPLPC
jgi:hypothetical protein